mmetsp:Transcript_24801/g.59042  ORF Transcript_24801/g.59042 Transcript_24801/m.59042 type:complete len:265 (+) Transcript_24801:1017-1811(+)
MEVPAGLLPGRRSGEAPFPREDSRSDPHGRRRRARRHRHQRRGGGRGGRRRSGSGGRPFPQPRPPHGEAEGGPGEAWHVPDDSRHGAVPQQGGGVPRHGAPAEDVPRRRATPRPVPAGGGRGAHQRQAPGRALHPAARPAARARAPPPGAEAAEPAGVSARACGGGAEGGAGQAAVGGGERCDARLLWEEGQVGGAVQEKGPKRRRINQGNAEEGPPQQAAGHGFKPAEAQGRRARDALGSSKRVGGWRWQVCTSSSEPSRRLC